MNIIMMILIIMITIIIKFNVNMNIVKIKISILKYISLRLSPKTKSGICSHSDADGHGVSNINSITVEVCMSISMGISIIRVKC